MLKVRFNSLQILCSPSLGGLIEVALSMCKKWSVGLYENVLEEEFGDFDIEYSTENGQQSKNEEQPMTTEEQEALGFYNVEKILKHKYQQGWKFLVAWENFPISASTWEPISSFLHPNGSLNSVFKRYCEEKKLENVLRQALSCMFHSPVSLFFPKSGSREPRG